MIPSPPISACRRDILVVDDDEDIRDAFCELLEEEGYQVRCAGNGAEALEQIDASTPCVVLLDMMMPVMSGAEVMLELERRESLEALPVVVVSAHIDSCEGARDVLRKPISVDELLDVVERFCAAPGTPSSAS
ncbi:MAG: chemotaxis protein CheY [Myxococcaceae bacterium]|nr:chemotaxis protein CheY [Myxococcaceae bacterium]